MAAVHSLTWHILKINAAMAFFRGQGIGMREYLRGLSPTTEFVVVVLVAFGYFIFGSIWTALNPVLAVHHSHVGLVVLAVYEIVLMALLAPFLAVRGWTFDRIGFVPSLKDTGIGILLCIGAYLAWMFVWDITVAVSPGTASEIAAVSGKVVTPAVPLAIAALVAIVNPIFEEVFVTGYVMSALRERVSPLMCVNASVVLRLLYHLYQGPLGVLSIIPTGLIFAYWYARTQRLWPLIVAHALMDFVALIAQ